MALPSELRTPLIASILSLIFPTPQTKEIQIDDAEDKNPGDNNIAVAITLIQIVKILKIHKFNLYYSN